LGESEIYDRKNVIGDTFWESDGGFDGLKIKEGNSPEFSASMATKTRKQN
jgi:hypothetical protein